ncbi:C-terminal domain phosphatase-like 3 [Artemisia annua]|uniref:C-terminal domain phosphatase-like 3 n=1 Tax=Artemisia annua TaxID=35608 RepID=A0A2U1L0M5_ARTAN|nr:C-terminal domain phosphatase-like 3 [Artemisia annua]
MARMLYQPASPSAPRESRFGFTRILFFWKFSSPILFEDVCSRLEDLLETLSTLLSDNADLSKDDLVQLAFSVRTVFSSMNQNKKELKRQILSRMLTNVKSYTPVETMFVSCNKDVVGSSTSENDKDVDTLAAPSAEITKQKVSSVSQEFDVLDDIPIRTSNTTTLTPPNPAAVGAIPFVLHSALTASAHGRLSHDFTTGSPSLLSRYSSPIAMTQSSTPTRNSPTTQALNNNFVTPTHMLANSKRKSHLICYSDPLPTSATMDFATARVRSQLCAPVALSSLEDVPAEGDSRQQILLPLTFSFIVIAKLAAQGYEDQRQKKKTGSNNSVPENCPKM